VADSDTCDVVSWATIPLMRRVAQRPHVRMRLGEEVNMVDDDFRRAIIVNFGKETHEEMRCEREQHRTLPVSAI
jgi:hypothetical protein